MKIMEQFTCKKKNPPTTSCLLQSDKIELDGSNLDLEKLKEQRIWFGVEEETMDFIDSLATDIVHMESGDHQVSKLHQILRSPGWFSTKASYES